MSLSRRLRNAAIRRAENYGEVIDSCVLGPDGVLDLRTIDDSHAKAPSTRPAAALEATRGGFENVTDLSDLYRGSIRHRIARRHLGRRG